MGSIGGAALITDVDGNCSVDDVGEDLVLSLHFKTGLRYRFSVGEDVLCNVFPGDSVRFTMPEDAETSIQVPGANCLLDGISCTVIVGNGDVLVKFESIGDTFKLVTASELIDEIPDIRL